MIPYYDRSKESYKKLTEFYKKFGFEERKEGYKKVKNVSK